MLFEARKRLRFAAQKINVSAETLSGAGHFKKY